MKKVIYSLIFIVVLSLMTGCSKKDTILKNIEINENKCEIEKEADTHGGFLGDGDYFAKIKCPKIDYDNLSKKWKKLPLSKELKEIVEMEKCDDKDCKNIYERFSIPDIKIGYYYFINRQSDSEDKNDDTKLNEKSSWNFTLAILDKAKNIIYYYELDT